MGGAFWGQDTSLVGNACGQVGSMAEAECRPYDEAALCNVYVGCVPWTWPSVVTDVASQWASVWALGPPQCALVGISIINVRLVQAVCRVGMFPRSPEGRNENRRGTHTE